MMLRLLGMLTLGVTVAAGCGGGDNGGGGGGGAGGPAAPNNSATLAGTALGSGAATVAQMVRSVPVTASGAGFSATTLYIGRRSTTATMDYLAIPVTNTSGSLRCFVKATTYTINAGAITEDHSGSYISGSVGVSSSSSVYTASCLQPGETAYLLDLSDNDIFSTAAGATIALTFSTSSFEQPAAKAIPQSYTFAAGVNTITVKNVGTAAADLSGGFHETVLLDADGKPMFWTFLDAATGTILQPGATGTIVDNGMNWAGSAPMQAVYVDFEAPASGTALRLSPGGPDAEQQKAVLQQLAAKRQRLQP